MCVSNDRTVVGGRIGGVRADVVSARLCCAAVALIMLPACGAEDGSGGTDMAADELAPTDNPVEGLSISVECQGIDFTDRIYSPGGTALPNICEPFHATTNNPHAVRCTDAWPWYDTGFPGDDLCILPPEPDSSF